MKSLHRLATPLLVGVLGLVAALPGPLGPPDAHAAEGDAHGHNEGHEEEENEGSQIRLSPDVMDEFGIEVRVATGGTVAQTVTLPGEVVYNADGIAHVRPMVSGIVQRVEASVGDRVAPGQRLAVLNSRELAATRSAYLAATARLELARENLERDRRLFTQKVGTERAVLAAEQAFREAQIDRNQARSALQALGYSKGKIGRLGDLDEHAFNTYDLLAPLKGIVTRRHAVIGEIIGPEVSDAPFVVADLSSVWVNLTVYQRDLVRVQAGQPVTITFGHGIPDAHGTIAFVSPALDAATRTATARVVLANPRGEWRPGLFVSGLVETGEKPAAVVLPRSALTRLDGRTVVFVAGESGLEPREIRLGQVSPNTVEVAGGLTAGERYVATNVLAVKAELNRAALEHAGHAH
ncbi:MAG: efflux RND transporter periplasmic adaptor subunit [Gammaproteobacteria bacterium]|nr:efflux RND transporter periplasmic adaptor subunit [Gammaproteobacteria bacterium]